MWVVLLLCAVVAFLFFLWKKKGQINTPDYSLARKNVGTMVLYCFHGPNHGKEEKGLFSFSPACLKVEAFFRAHNIPYTKINEGGAVIHPRTKKTPYVTYQRNSTSRPIDIPESQRILEFAMKEFDVNPDKRLSEEERAVSVAFQR